MRYLKAFSVAALCLASGALGAQTPDQKTAAIAPKAAETLQRMSKYMAGLEQFSFVGHTTLDAPLDSCQQIQIGARIEVNVRRPNSFRVNRRGDLGGQEFYYDGKRLTYYSGEENEFAHLDAPPTIEAALDLLTDKGGVVAPGSDLVYLNAYEELMHDVNVGLYLGESEVDGVPVHHLAFRAKEVDWQIWIDSGDKPLPRKYLITTKWLAGSPRFTLRLTEWNTAAAFDDSLFQFDAPAEAVAGDLFGTDPAKPSTK
jgi:hypothetical protein